MRLKSIKLAGFKSFVDPTHVLLPSNLVAILGPNGCGKSNVIDAVRWVMGESSAKYLRGESITDVIFNGSTSRKPVGQASVELHFDNEDGSLGGQYASYSEISIRRQVTRDGQSHYYLNGSRCRRRDIIDIFLGTGLGPRSYAIIEQGTISRLIEAKPEELRIYLEEAAGISKYKERRRETELRIQHTRDNLTRLNDVREELAKQLQHLEKQAAIAEKYKVLKQEERLLKAQLYALRWKNLNTRAEQCDAAIKTTEVNLEAQVAQQRAIELQLAQWHAQQLEASDHHRAVQSRYYQSGAEISRLEQQLQHNRERRQQLQTDIQQAEHLWQDAEHHLADDEHKIDQLQAELIDIEPQITQVSAAADESAKQLADAEQHARYWQQRWDEFNHQSASATQQAQVEQTRLQHLEQRLANIQQRLARLQQEYQLIDASALQDEVLTLELQLEQVTEQQQMAQDACEEILAQINSRRQTNQQLSQHLNTLMGSHQSLQGRHASLEALQQAALGQKDTAVMNWLKQHQLADYPRLAQSFVVAEGWELAIETVLGDYLQAICIPDLRVIQQQVAELTQGTLTFIAPWQEASIAPGKPFTPLSDKVSSHHTKPAFLSSIYVADNVTQALAGLSGLEAHESVVTKDGIWIGQDWVRVMRGDDAQSGILQRERELASLQKETVKVAEAIEQLQADLAVGQQVLQSLETQREELQRQQNDNASRVADIRAQLHIKQSKAEQLQQRAVQLNHEIHECQVQLEDDRRSYGLARTAWQEALQLSEEYAQQRPVLLQERELQAQRIQQIRQRAQTDKDIQHQLALQQRTLNTQLQAAKQQRERLLQQVQSWQQRLEELQQLLIELEEPVAAYNEQLSVALHHRSQLEAELTAAKQALDHCDYTLREFEQQRQSTVQKVEQIRQALEQQRLEWQAVLTRRDAVVEQLNETTFDLAILLQELPAAANEAEWQAQLARVTQRIERLGAVNLAAIEELVQQQERKSYLDVQNEDLIQALAMLEDAIRKIDRETRSRFKDTYEQVNGSFQALFPRVFGGGRAYLELTGEDLLDTGITVMAQPPGKRNSTIHLLSGGEKAMTAAALVFAIFQLNPAPFCMLDEVDAPLDDTNVSRFCNLVREMSAKTQFIFITHNKVTMELAEHLIGVTMNEPGVSRLVAVDMQAALTLAEA